MCIRRRAAQRHFYEQRLVETYLQKPAGETEPIYLHTINPMGSTAPYLILNGAASQGFNNAQPNLPFEFTRDFCGAPEYGYIRTRLLDHPVVSVLHETNNGTLKARFVKLKKEAFPAALRPAEHPIKLGTAIAASGAAADSAGTGFLLQLGLKLVGGNLRYETRNYAQTLDRWYQRPLDRLREILFDRFWDTTRGNTIAISDGNHVENFGILAMVARQVQTILIADASMDPDYDYTSLLAARDRVNRTDCSHCKTNTLTWTINPLPARANQAPLTPFTRSQIQCSECDYRADVLYLKSSFDTAYPGMTGFLSHYQHTDTDKFPHTSTGKQWYTYDEFEAYRQLGHALTRWAIASNPDFFGAFPK